MVTAKAKFRPLTGNSGQGKLYIQIIHDRQVRSISTNHIIYADEWDPHKDMFTLSNSHSRSRLDELHKIHKSIQTDLSRINSIVKRLDTTCLYYSVTDIVDSFHSHTKRFSLINFMNYKIRKLQYLKKFRTAQNYKSTLNSFMSFRKNEDIIIECITQEMIEDYETFLQLKYLKPNTTSFYMRILRAVCNAAAEEGAIVANGIFKHVYTGIDKTEKRALPLKVMKKIQALDLTSWPSIDYARDIFMLSFFTRGMSFIDMAFLLKSDLRNGRLTYSRHKTGQRLSIKWTSEMQEIVDKYGTNPTPYLFPILLKPQFSSTFRYQQISSRINYNLKKLAKMVDWPMNLTLYSARHSWASIARNQGIPLSIISQGMGHDSERTTRIYLSSVDNTPIDRANTKIINALR